MSLSNKIAKGFLWSALERMSVQIVQFIVGIILARMLTPKEYGIIGILLVFIAFLQVFIDSGFSKALIQKQDRSAEDISTVFIFNIGISVTCYLALWIGAPLIARFYQNAQLVEYIRVLGLCLLFNALFAIPMTLLTIDLNFKTIARINFIASVFSGIIAIIMAYFGFGVWALVFQIINRSVLSVFITWYLTKWKPKYVFSLVSLKKLFSFGSKLLYSSLLSMIINNFANLFIGKLSSIKALGFYTRGTQFSDIVFGSVSSVLDSVLLPTLSTLQGERKKLVHVTRSILRSVSLITIPLFLGMAIVARPLIRFLLTDKWLMAVPIMQIMCVARSITIISGINVNLLYALGRTDLELKQQYVKIIIRIVFLTIALKYGIIFIALAELASTSVHFFINTYYPGKFLKYGSFAQLKDMLPIIFSSIFMIIGVYFSIYFINTDSLKLLIAPIVAIPLYVCLVYLFGVPEFFMLSMRIKKVIANRIS